MLIQFVIHIYLRIFILLTASKSCSLGTKQKYGCCISVTSIQQELNQPILQLSFDKKPNWYAKHYCPLNSILLLILHRDITILCHLFIQAQELITICTIIFSKTINVWSSLLEDTVMADSVAAFCNKLKFLQQFQIIINFSATFVSAYVIVKPHHEQDILDITQGRGEAEAAC